MKKIMMVWIVLIVFISGCTEGKKSVGHEDIKDQKTKIFNENDCKIGPIGLGMTLEEVESIIGKSYKIVNENGNYDPIIEHEGTKIFFYKGVIKIIRTTTLEGPRGTKIGDSIEDVTGKYYDENNTIQKEEEIFKRLLW